jgi:hypothetical protein
MRLRAVQQRWVGAISDLMFGAYSLTWLVGDKRPEKTVTVRDISLLIRNPERILLSKSLIRPTRAAAKFVAASVPAVKGFV